MKNTLIQLFPKFRKNVSTFLRRCKQSLKWVSIAVAGRPGQQIRVSYGHRRLPGLEEFSHGGIVKFQRLNEFLPNRPYRFNMLYMVSSSYPADAEQLYQLARRKKSKFLWNQDGVAFPAWMPSGWEETNSRMAKFLHAADYVFYQSEFAKSCANKFLGEKKGPCEVLYNAVDTELFYPNGKKRNSNALTLLVMGSQYHAYRLESAIRSLAYIHKSRPHTRMLVAGRVWDNVFDLAEKLIKDLGIEAFIEFLGPFGQKEVVDIFHRCDILLHTKIQDPCPGVVIESMACGVPIVYSSSGGVPELVGEEAGVGVSTNTSWEKQIPPEPELWAYAVLRVAEGLSGYGEAARQRAVERFDLKPWVERHRQVFSEIMDCDYH